MAVCSAPINVIKTQTAPDTMHVQWQGSALTYKLLYKLETDEDWITLTMDGPGTTGGSGYLDDPTGPTILELWSALSKTGPEKVSPERVSLSADFTISSLAVGLYDLRLINVCDDGTDFMYKTKMQIAEAAVKIPNLHVISFSGMEVNVGWDNPSPDNGNDFVVSYCALDDSGKTTTECEAFPVPHGTNEFSIVSKWEKFRVAVTQAQNSWQSNSSDALFVNLCGCDDGSSFVVVMPPISSGTTTTTTTAAPTIHEFSPLEFSSEFR